LIVMVIAIGSWVGLRTQTSAATGVVDASAVVVTSEPCAAGGGTVVDVLAMGAAEVGGTTRATLDACGYREGQILAVEHVAGDPAQVTLAKPAAGSSNLLPIGLLVAALLAIGAAAAVWNDTRAGRLFRRSKRIELPGSFADSAAPAGSIEPGVSAGWIGSAATSGLHSTDETGPAPLDAVVADGSDTLIWTTGSYPPAMPGRTGRHARIEPTDADTDFQSIMDGPLGELGALDAVRMMSGLDLLDAAADFPDNSADKSVDQASGGSSAEPGAATDVDLVFPFDAEFAASLRDELFTHRGVPAG
jgi:hypothetical protein